MFTVLEVLAVLIDITSVLNRNIELEARPTLIKINITMVLVDIVFTDGFFEVKKFF